jgi:hypothetical protein
MEVHEKRAYVTALRKKYPADSAFSLLVDRPEVYAVPTLRSPNDR